MWKDEIKKSPILDLSAAIEILNDAIIRLARTGEQKEVRLKLIDISDELEKELEDKKAESERMKEESRRRAALRRADKRRMQLD